MFSTVQLRNFRSHQSLKLDFSPKTNVIIGPNGSGKTNILEAILMLGCGKSFRAHDSAVIRFKQAATKVTAESADHKRAIKLELKADGKVDKNFLVDEKKYKRLSFHKTAAVVLFEPNFMQLISRGPELRRDYFDGVLSRTQIEYQTLLNIYRRTLAQRNSLLKQPLVPTDQLFVWDIKLSELAAKIVTQRLRFTDELNQKLSRIYSEIAGSAQTIKIHYITATNTKDYANNLLSGLQKNRKKDAERGFTSLGPHRDDFGFLINHEAAVMSASRGENRTLLLALKIVEASLVESARGHKPILLLDDVFSELDETRQTRLVEYFKHNQVVITTTTITPLIKGVSGKIIEL